MTPQRRWLESPPEHRASQCKRDERLYEREMLFPLNAWIHPTVSFAYNRTRICDECTGKKATRCVYSGTSTSRASVFLASVCSLECALICVIKKRLVND